MNKIWGRSEEVFRTPLIEVFKIEVEPCSWCSLHKHVGKHNAFIVISGVLSVLVRRESGERWINLKPGDFLNVEAGVFHQFETYGSGCGAYEVYSPNPLGSEDIIRVSEGGTRR